MDFQVGDIVSYHGFRAVITGKSEKGWLHLKFDDGKCHACCNYYSPCEIESCA